MEQRVKKKYVEKTAPDKPNPTQNAKPKYLPKEEVQSDQQKYTKPYNNNERNQMDDFNRNPYKRDKPYNNYERTDKPKYEPRQKDERQREEKPSYEPRTQQRREPLQKQPNLKAKRQYYEKPRLGQKQSSHFEQQSCVICSESIRKRDYIWTCSCCYISMHLKCIKTWILNVNKDKNKNEILFTWTCPQCKFEFNELMPKYYCFCGKFKQPQYERDIDPHSCGQICGRKRGPYCPHPCPQLCHKGKCKPCEHQGTLVTCECGKTSRTVKCSEQRQIFQCGKKCQRILNCCKHKCQRNCHHGACLPCKKKHLVSCYCGKNQDVVDCIEISYSCEQVCGKTLNCGFHTCQQKCHQGPCGDCQKTPQLQKTCPCESYTIQMLTGDQFFRKSCQDPIPTCGMPCKKILSCGHKCSKSCHEGRCSECKIIVNQNCLCGLTSRKIECFRAHSHKQTLKCDNVCKRKRACGQHNCNTECCPHRNSPQPGDHPCQLTCPKMLNCGKHTCGQNCHMGLCKKCPVIYSQPQPCPCGKTSLRPPIVCGTIVPQCDNVCQLVMECGHKCMKMCHYGSCQCMEDVFVKCRCGKQEIKTVCGRQALCLNKCSNVLACGHKCGIQCHKDSCQEAHKHHPCRKLCEKIRTDCGHSCGQHCHPSKKCSQFPCQAQIFIKCECGHRQTSILCGMSEDKRHKKEIKCNTKCQNLKRFDVLYKGKQVYYPTNMVHFALKNIGYIQNVQAKLAKFILQSEDPVVELEYKFSDNQSKLILLNLFENHYHLNAHFYRHKKFASFTLLQTENTMIPKPTLSEYVTKITKGEIKRANLPFEFTVSFEFESKDKSDLVLRTLKPYMHKYYLERKEKSVLIHFWSEEDGIRVLNALQAENPHVQFKGEQHVNDEDIEIIAETDIIQTELTEEEIQANAAKKKEEAKRKISSEQKGEEDKKIRSENKVVSQQTQQEEEINEQPKKIMKTIPPPPTQQPHKKKIVGAPKIIIKKSNLIFQPKEYPDSKENVQDIYLIDEDELYSQQVDWEKLVVELANKNMGPEATEWRIRAFLMISSFADCVRENIMKDMLEKLLKMYRKDKQRARRILELQKLDTRVVKQEMAKDGIYLSDHEPEMLAYLMLFNYFCTDKIDLELEEHQLNTLEVTQAQQLLHSVQYNNFQEFYSICKSAQYVLSCALIPFIHALRQNTLDLFEKHEKIPVQNLFKYLFFNSEEELISYWKVNGVEVGTKFSKKLQQQAYYMSGGEVKKEKVRNSDFIQQFIKVKRDRKYFLVEPEQLVDDRWMTRSFFAFGDFKETISNKYIIALIKTLRNSN